MNDDLPIRPSARLRLFIDTSIIIASALSARGTARALLDMIGQNACEGFISPYVIDEVQRNLSLKAPVVAPDFLQTVAELGLHIVTATSEQVTRVESSVERKDAPVVAAVLAANVDALVTFDKKHLLNRSRDIEDAFGLTVVDAGAILTWLTPKQP